MAARSVPAPDIVDPAPRPRARPRIDARVMTRLMAGILATSLLFSVAEGTQHAEAGKKFKTVTRSFSSNGQIDIPAIFEAGPANPFPATIKVNAFKKYKRARIKDVELTLRGFGHTYPDNVDVMLARGNTRATVMSDVGGNTDVNDLQITLDDQAAASLPDDGPLVSGVFRPTNETGVGEADAADDPITAPAPAPNDNVALSTFKGSKPDGVWRLYVEDDFDNDTGELANGWSLKITAKVKEKKDKTDKKGKK